MKNNDEKFMKMALLEAKKGQYHTWKDPMVGCLIAKNGKVIAKGYHKSYGTKHAAIEAIKNADPHLLVGSDLYLTMEPCKKCSEQIANLGIKRLIVAQNNPKFAVNKNSLSAAMNDEIDITIGVLRQEAIKLNRFYNYYYQNGRPFITVKQSLSLDHNVGPSNGKYTSIINSAVHDYIHHERAQYQALLIGSSTAIIDNPNLLTDINTPYQPIRIIIDRRGRLLNNQGLNLLNRQNAETWIFTQNSNMHQLTSNNIQVFQINTEDIEEIISFLADQGIQSVYLEGGPTLEKTFMDAGYVNRITNYISPIYFGKIGLKGAIPIHEFALKNIQVAKIDDNIRISGDVEQIQPVYTY